MASRKTHLDGRLLPTISHPAKYSQMKKFTALGWHKGIPVWPAEEFLHRRGDDFTPEQRLQILEYNKTGIVEGNDPVMEI